MSANTVSNPGVKETLALLDALKDAGRDFAAREEKLNADYYGRTSAVNKAADDAAVDRTRKLAEDACDADTEFGVAQEHLESKFESRKAWISRAHASVRDQVMREIGAQSGQLKDLNQTQAVEAGQHRENALAENVATLENFRQKIADAGERFAALTKAVRSAFAGGSRGQLKHKWPEPDLAPDENKLYSQFEDLEKRIGSDLTQFRKFLVPQIFRFLPIWLLGVLLLGFAIAIPTLKHFGVMGANAIPPSAVIGSVVVFVVVLVVYLVGGQGAKPLAKTIAGNLAKAGRLLEVAAQKAEQTYAREQVRIKDEFETALANINKEWRLANRKAMNSRGARPVETDVRAGKIFQKHEQKHLGLMDHLEKEHSAKLKRIHELSSTEGERTTEAHAAQLAKFESEFQAGWQTLQADWKTAITSLYEKIRAVNAEAEKTFPAWEADAWKNWKPPQQFQNAAKFGRLDVDATKFVEVMPKDPRLALPEPKKFSVPLSLDFPFGGSALFETNKGGETEAVTAINDIIFRLLSITPPGKVNFTIFDPIGLGQNFAALMHLADYEEGYINSRIWTQSAQFEEKLAELNDHMEKVIQMYLRNEYATIADYNAQAGSIAEKYHFLVIASFPVNFSDTAAKRLRNIAANGARCGVYVLMHWDQRNAAPTDFVPDELRKNSVRLVRVEKEFYIADWREPGTHVVFDQPPSPEFATKFLHDVGESSKNSTRVEVPFQQVAPANGDIWSEETTEELRVAIGRSGATKFQYLEIGKGTRQHALIAGKTGSGKSTLFHIIITNLALWCSPEQVEFYLVDFKKGVEFKCYASRKLPHAKVVAIESDRAFGLSVLQRVDDELRRRGDLFRQLGAQDVAGYKRAGGKEAMPRCLLMIDEFQEFFTEEDRVSQGAAVLLDRIVRQGRAFGIHVLLGSQTLGGAYTLARATIGQMVIRIALQCNEADAYLIMDQDNPAPRLLTRPGEGIYNDAAGALEGNSPFQAVWLSEDVRDDYLEKVRTRADERKFPGPFVFEGSAPADVRENLALRDLLETTAAKAPVQSRIWLGAPNSIKGPTEAVFQRQSGSNLLIVGQSEERSLTIMAVALASLAAQFPRESAKFYLFDATPPGFSERDFLERVSRAGRGEVIPVGNANLSEAMAGLAEEMKKRSEGSVAPEIFLLINGLQNFKKLRQEDEFSFSSSSSDAPNPGAILQNLINEGPALGVHIIVTCDTYNNVNRFLGRKTLQEFEMRVLFQMSASDSASLIDSPDAGSLGLHRALYYNDREGYTEIFRPYARPGNDWVEKISVVSGVKG
ncbi:MAG TPA: FtsK/SpoIIIE domain-containing protein [Verrucomicrobiae bacterium]